MKKILMLALFICSGMFVHAYQNDAQGNVITYTDKKPKKRQDTNDVLNQSAALDSLLTAEESIAASERSIPFTPIN